VCVFFLFLFLLQLYTKTGRDGQLIFQDLDLQEQMGWDRNRREKFRMRCHVRLRHYVKWGGGREPVSSSLLDSLEQIFFYVNFCISCSSFHCLFPIPCSFPHLPSPISHLPSPISHLPSPMSKRAIYIYQPSTHQFHEFSKAVLCFGVSRGYFRGYLLSGYDYETTRLQMRNEGGEYFSYTCICEYVYKQEKKRNEERKIQRRARLVLPCRLLQGYSIV
jgi:hypothetical protein